MNVSMAASLLAVDAAAGAQAGSGNGGDGEGFGLAVKDAEQKHDGKRAAAKDAAPRGARGKSEDRSGKSTEDMDAPKADVADGTATPADVLGRLLEATLTASFSTPSAAASGNAHPDAAGDDSPDGTLQERIVISTVADLAGSEAEAGEKSKRVSLRVTGMETHFEPRLDGATLVEADRLAATKRVSPVETASTAPKQAFEEILQRLGDSQTEGDRGEADGERQSGRNEARSSRGAAARAQGEAPVASVKAHETFVDRPDAQAKGASTGQVVNAQIATRIVEAFASSSESPARSSDPSQSAAGAQLLRMTAGGAALKTLSIQLEPQDLGRVDVSMRLIDGRLQVELAASEPATAAALAGDRHGLRKILEHAGFALDDAAISIVSRDLGQGSAAAGPATGGADAGRQAASHGSPFNRSSDDRPSGERQTPNERRRQADEDSRNELSSRASSAAGSVYL